MIFKLKGAVLKLEHAAELQFKGGSIHATAHVDDEIDIREGITAHGLTLTITLNGKPILEIEKLQKQVEYSSK